MISHFCSLDLGGGWSKVVEEILIMMIGVERKM